MLFTDEFFNPKQHKLPSQPYTFSTITTTQFHPSSSWIQSHCVDASATVQRWFDRSRFRKPLFLITGLKIVTGNDSSAESKTTRGGGADVSATVDGTIWSAGAVPLGGGPKVEVHHLGASPKATACLSSAPVRSGGC